MSSQTGKMPNDLFLQCVEIQNDLLVWRNYRQELGLPKSNRCIAGDPVSATMGGIDSARPYVRINIKGTCYQISYAKALYWAKTKIEPSMRVWFVDGNQFNLRASNVDGDFHAWWDIRGVQSPGYGGVKKKPLH